MKDYKVFILLPDDECDYKFSDGLFWFFYNSLEFIYDFSEIEPKDLISLKHTYEDNSDMGCRIWYNDGTYTKYTDVGSFIMSLPTGMYQLMGGESMVKLSDFVNAYYKITTL